MTVCRYFLQGNCRFGDRCRFEHASNQHNYSDSRHGSHRNYEDNYGNQYNYRNQDYYSSERHGRSTNQNYSSDRYGPQQSYGSPDRYGNRRYESPDRHGNQRYESPDRYGNQRYESPDRYGQNFSDDNYGVDIDQTRYNNKSHGSNHRQWVSDAYKSQNQQVSNSFNASTPNSKTSFSYKNSESESKHPLDLHMNEKNVFYAGVMKEDALAWEIGGQWPFTCYAPIPEKACFPGFIDLSPEELRYQDYNAKQNNSYDMHINNVKEALLDVKFKRDQLKSPSVQLISAVDQLVKGELHLDNVDGASLFNKPNTETMFLGNSSQISAETFSFKSAFGNENSNTTNSAAAFSFKTVQMDAKAIALNKFDEEIYTHLDKLSAEDREQFSAPTFTLGKIPTVPPPQSLCF